MIDKEKYLEDGFFILRKDQIVACTNYLERLGVSLHHNFLFQLKKISSSYDNFDEFSDELADELNRLSGEAEYEALKLSSASSHFCVTFFDWMAHRLIGGFSALYQHLGPHLLINRPSNKQLLYRWHAECNYYPKRKRFVNIWCPLIREKNEGNGTMWFKKGSHKRSWPTSSFSEYTGYDRENHNKKGHFRQFEIPESELEEFESVSVIAEPGDAVFFHPNMVHCGTLNKSDKNSYAAITRVFNIEDDLTLSSDMAVTPYSGNDLWVPRS